MKVQTMNVNSAAAAEQASASSLRVLMTRARRIEVGRILLTGLVALLFWRQWVPLQILWLAVAIGLYPLVKTGLIDLIRERKVGTEIFVTVATLVAVFGGETVAGAVLMVIILIAEFIADLNMDRARASIKTLIGSVPQVALMRGADGERVVPIEQLRTGDVVLVRASEKIPVDGSIVGGAALINEAPITGESLPKDKSIGASVFAGTIVASGAVDIQTEKVGSDTTFARIIGLVENAKAAQAPVQKLADKVAAWLIPVVFVFLIAVYMVTGDVRTIVTLLIFTSPAELGLATPLVMIAAIARAARSGILVKGGLYLESLAKADVMVFDKTGTLTANKSEVVRVEARDARFSEMELLSLAAAADRRSAHPLAKAVVDYATLKQIAVPEPDQYEQMQGRGVIATVSGRAVLVGNAALLRENGVTLATAIEDGGQTPVHVAVDGHFAGVIFIADVLRPGAREALEKLKRTGVKRIVMLTGDNEATARAVAAELGVDEVRANLMPEDKVAAIEELKKQGHRVAMIGDGINDAPALARADVGIAMGGGGTQAALEAADIVLMTDDLSKIVSARAIARRAYRTIQENLFVGVGVVHVLGITAALMGWIGPIEAALLHLGPDVLVFVNSAKLLRVRIDGDLNPLGANKKSTGSTRSSTMAEKLKLDLSLVLPDVADERDACVGRLTELLQAEGLEKVHLVREDGIARLCLHYDPQQFSVSRVRELAQAAGAKLGNRYRHENLRIDGMDCPTCATVIEHALQRTDGVLEASVSYAAERLRLEFDSEKIERPAIVRRIQALGYAVLEEGREAGWFAEHRELIFSGVAGLLLLAGWLAGLAGAPRGLALGLLLGAYAAGGFYTLRDAWQSLRSRRFDIDILMIVAAAGAAALGAWEEGALLLFLFSLGHALEHMAMDRARKAIEALAELAPKTAIVQRDGAEIEVRVEELQRGDRVIVKPGQRIPADGQVASGNSAVDQAPVTGESMPVDKQPGDKVFAATVNGEGALVVEVTKLARESTLARMVEMVAEAQTQKSPTQRFTDRFERIFVPVVLVGAGLLIALPPLFGFPFAESFYRAMAVLVAASPCALAIATPSAVLSGIARAARGGVLIKGGVHLENLGVLTAIAFDKTGTLTIGKPKVTDVVAVSGDEAHLLTVAAAVESRSAHPLAQAVVAEAKGRGLTWSEAGETESVTGKGVRAEFDGLKVAIGNAKLFDGEAIPEGIQQHAERLQAEGKTIMLIQADGQFLGVVALADTPREAVKQVLERLRQIGIRKTIMLTGDNERVGRAIADAVGLDEVKAGLLPEDKVKAMEELGQRYGQVAMVGDGVNDAPAMARATVGIAMGGAGTDVALETADVALMADDLSKLPFAVALSRASRRIIRQNLWVSLGVVALLIPATLLGWAGIGLAVLIHEGSTLVVVINALRLLAYVDCCAGEKQDTSQPIVSIPVSGMTFKIEGLDCAEEVATLKSAIGPIVGGSDKLALDVLNGRMTLLPEAGPVTEKTIVKAVAATGMKATRWQAGQAQADVKQLHRSKTVYTTLSGMLIMVGMLIHIAMAGGFSDAQTFLSHPENWSLHWAVITEYLTSLFNAHTQQAMPLPEKIAFGLAVIFGARHVLVKAFYALKRLRADMNLLMMVAVIGAIFIDEWFEAATVSFLFSLSLAIESWSIGRARHAVEALLDLAPSTVTIKDETGQERRVPAAEVSIGSRFIVAPGDKIPLDGDVITGFSSVNQAPITGESMPVAKQVGDEVFAGSINGEATLEIKSSKLVSDTTLAHITRLVGEAHSKRAEAEQWVEKFARIYTPVVMILALAVFIIPPLFLEGIWNEWFYRALVLLVIACPCALVISTPVSIVAALASAARQGILIKGGIYIEAPAHLNAIAFDKTGTLTCGEPIVTGVYPFNGHSEEELLSRAAALEARSNHPLAKAILQYTKNLGISVASADNVTVLPGKGVTGLFNDTDFWLGSRRYLLERSQEVPEISEKAIVLEQTGQTVIAIGNDRHICGLIAVADQPRAQIKSILQSLRQKGIKHLVMLTGDNRVTANNIAAQIGIDEVHAELLPADKVDIVSQMVEKYGQVAMIGDGINDAPALGRANLGIAMGVLGSDAAIEIADIALMGDDLSKLPWLISHSKRTLAIIRQNIIFALTIKAAFALLAFAGLATLWEAIAADMGASLVVVANGLRLLHPK